MAESNPDVKNTIAMVNFDERVAQGPPRFEVSIQMHIFYKMIVDGLDLDVEEGTGKFIEGIKLYVFLAAMFESWINDFTRRYLNNHRDVPREMFDAVERQQLHEKLKVLVRAGGEGWRERVALIRTVSEMRNRLLHFKDVPTVAEMEAIEIPLGGGRPTFGDLIQGIRQVTPNPRIYDDLVSQDLGEVRAKATDLYRDLQELVPSS